MKKLFSVCFLMLACAVFSFGANRYWISTTSSNWNNTANWSTVSGGAGGASVPGAADVAIFNGVGGRNGNCAIDLTTTVGGITVGGYTGTIDLAGFTITLTGTLAFTTGTVTNSGAAASITLNATTTTFGGTLFSANISGTSGSVLFNGSTFNNPVSVTKTNAATDASTGNNTFNNTFSLTSTGTGAIRMAGTTRDIYNAAVTLSVSSTGTISMSYTAVGNQFNDNIILNYTAASGIGFGANGGTSTLASGKTFSSITSGGAGCGNLNLLGFTQLGATTQNITLSGNNSANLTLGTGTSFAANVNFVAPNILLNGATYNGTAYLEQTGTATATGTGGNTFSAATTLVNSGTGTLISANTSPDIFNGDLSLTLNNTGSISLAYAAATTTQFNGNISVTYNSTGGIVIGNSSASTLATGKTITVSSPGASGSGNLTLSKFTQLGATAQTISLGVNPLATLSIGPSSTFNAALTASAPNLLLNSSTFQGTTTLTKLVEGTTTDAFRGGNFFNGTFIITNQNSNDVYFGNTAGDPGDTWNGPATFNDAGGGRIRIGMQTTGNVFNNTAALNVTAATNLNSRIQVSRLSPAQTTFNGAVTLNNAGNASDIQISYDPGTSTTFNGPVTVISNTNTAGGTFYIGYDGTVAINNNITFNSLCNDNVQIVGNNGSATLGNGFSMSVGGSGFASGTLTFSNFTQTGSTPQSLTLTGTAKIVLGPASTFNGNVNFVAPQINLNGTTYNGTAYIEKNGATNNTSNGGNTFNSTTTIVDSGTGQLILANASPDIFNGDLTVTNTGSNSVLVAYNVAGNQFNGNVIVNQPNPGTGIYFSSSATGSSTMAAGKTISVGGLGFSSSDLRLNRFTQLGSAAINLTLTGTARLRVGPSSSFGGNVNFVAPQITLDGATFSGTAYIEKNGANTDTGAGGNTFNSTTTIVDSGSGQLQLAGTNPDIFNGNATFTNTGSNLIQVAYTATGNQFNGNILVNNTGGTGIYFSNNGGSSTLASGNTISVGGTGFNTGELRLISFTQVGSTSQSVTLTGNALLTLGPSSSFSGNVNFVAPQIQLNGTTFNGTAYIEKNGATGNTSSGGNLFNSTSTIVNSGSGSLLMANTSADIFNNDVTITNTGSNVINMANNVSGNQFNGNIIVNSTGGTGIYFSNSATGSSTLANGKTITVGGIGFTFGELRLARFTQVGGTPQSITLTNVGVLTVGPASTFNGNVVFVTPSINLNGCTYNGTATITKNGASNDTSLGSNIFSSTTSFTNSGSGFFRNASTGLDTFNGPLTLTNSGLSEIDMSYTTSGTVFNGNIIVNCTNGTGIYFGQNGGTSSMASGNTISLGGSGFNTGELRLYRFTQVGATAQALTLTGIASLRIGNSSVFNGSVNFQAPQLYLDGATYNGTTTLIKTGATSNTGNGGNTFATTTSIINNGSANLRTNGNNTFNGTTSITNNSPGDLLLELTSGSTYNGDVTFTNTSSSYVRAAYIGTNNFNGNILVNSTNGTGVYFCENAAGTATLATGKTIAVGGTGFTAGGLSLVRFTQNGATAQNITLTTNGIFYTGPSSTWNGTLSVSAPQVFLNGAIFNGASTFTKTGTTTDASNGGNTFNAAVTFNNSNIGTFRLANTSGDTFNSSSTYNQTSGTIQPTYNSGSTYVGDITVNGASAMTFGTGGAAGVMTFSGALVQSISITGVAPTFNRIVMNKSGGQVNLNTKINIGVSALFTSGVIYSSSTNFVNFVNNATALGASNSSYVDGPVQKTGNQAFTFPVGNGGIYRLISITAPAVNTDAFTAQYFHSVQPFGNSLTSPILIVSGCEYWNLNRTNGASNVSVTLSWNSPDCAGTYVTNPASVVVGRWNGSSWVSNGNGSTTGNATTGTVTSSAAVTSFGSFALASTSLANPLPIELVYFNATPDNRVVKLSWLTASELNNDFFTLERSADGAVYDFVGSVKGAGTTSSPSVYNYADEQPYPGLSYYRLKQTDFNKVTTIVAIAIVSRSGEDTSFIVYPNPTSSLPTVNSNFEGPVTIFNNLGQPVLAYPNGKQMDVRSLSPGVYIFRTSTGYSQRLVVD